MYRFTNSPNAESECSLTYAASNACVSVSLKFGSKYPPETKTEQKDEFLPR